MGPPQNSGGEAGAPTTSSRRRRRFNGAAAEQRRRDHLALDFVAWLVLASMGPPQNSGGERLRLRERERRKIASMGPPQNSGGESYVSELIGSGTDLLQWGRRRTAAERPCPSGPSLTLTQLQWGRRRTAAESGLLEVIRRQVDGASMGPPQNSGGELENDVGPNNRSSCFNGAAAEQRRRGPQRTPRARTTRRGFNGAAAEQRRRASVEA